MDVGDFAEGQATTEMFSPSGVPLGMCGPKGYGQK